MRQAWLPRRINQYWKAAGGCGPVRHRSCSLDPKETTVRIEGLNVNAGKTHEMNPVALLTPTYGRDLELCTLLCKSVDRLVSSFSKHYLLVPDCDVPLFSHFESERRSVVAASEFLP